MQKCNNKDSLSIERNEIISKYHNGPIKNQDDDWENPHYSIYHETDYYGFIHFGGITDDFLSKEAKIRKLDCKREMKWRKLLEKRFSLKSNKTKGGGSADDQFLNITNRMHDISFREEMTKRVYKGVPQTYKLTIWHALLDINDMKNKKPKVYQMMLKKALEKSPDVFQIDVDVKRTFGHTIYFRERYGDRQKALFHVLSAYSMYNTEIGYCQGMSDIAGLLLMYLVDEEDVFWGLSQLMTSTRWSMHGMFIVGFPRILTFFAHHNTILQKLLPKIAKHFDKLELMTSAYALKWFMQCFLDRVPFTLFLRLWDIYLLEGEKLLFAMAYNILKLHRKRIIKMDFGSLMQFFQTEIRKDFLYDDEFVIESLKICIEELKKHKLLTPPTAQSNELPTRPFGTDLDFQTPSLTSVKERQMAQANPEDVIRRSVKKQKISEIPSNSVNRKSPSRSTSVEQRNKLTRSQSRDHDTAHNHTEHKPQIDTTSPSHIRYRISHSHSRVNMTEPQQNNNNGSLKRTSHISPVTHHKHLVKSVPDFSTDIPRSPTGISRFFPNDDFRHSKHRSTSPTKSNHISPNTDSNNSSRSRRIIKSQTISSFQRPVRITVKREPLSISPETVL